MTCLKACPHRSVEVNLRPPGIELWTTHQPRTYEVALMFLLLGAVYLHRLPELQQRLRPLPLEPWIQHSLVALWSLGCQPFTAAPSKGDRWLRRQLSAGAKPKRFVKRAYGYLPLVWAANLAHYLRLGLYSREAAFCRYHWPHLEPQGQICRFGLPTLQW
jgi:polyferredoxin